MRHCDRDSKALRAHTERPSSKPSGINSRSRINQTGALVPHKRSLKGLKGLHSCAAETAPARATHMQHAYTFSRTVGRAFAKEQ